MNKDQDKSFEKKLQSLSADFELTPADDSWNIIEAQLPEKKKRRFIFFLIPVGIIALMAGVFVLNKDDLSNIKIDDASMLSSPPIKELEQNISKGSDNTNNKTENTSNAITETPETKNEKEKNISENSRIVNSTFSSPTLKKHHQINSHFYSGINNVRLQSNHVNAYEHDVTGTSVIAAAHENSEINKIASLTCVVKNNFELNPATNNFQKIEPAKKKSHWSVGISYLPMLSNRKVSYNLENDNIMIIPDTSAHRKDENLFTNNFGADVYYHVNEKFYLHSGFYVINYGEKTFYDNRVYNVATISPTNLADFADYIVPGSATEFTNTYSFIQIPVNAGIALRTGTKTSLNIETGFSYGYLTGASALQLTTLNDSLPIKAYDDAQLNLMNRNHLFGNAAVSFDWFIAKQFSWSNGFIAQYQFTDMYKKDGLQSQHNYMFGLHTGLKFYFK